MKLQSMVKCYPSWLRSCPPSCRAHLLNVVLEWQEDQSPYKLEPADDWDAGEREAVLKKIRREQRIADDWLQRVAKETGIMSRDYGFYEGKITGLGLAEQIIVRSQAAPDSPPAVRGLEDPGI